MSLLRKRSLSGRRNKWLLAAACALLVLPCVAAATFALHFDVNPPDAGLIAQPAWAERQEDQEKAARESKERVERKKRAEQEEREMKERAARDPHFKAELEARERHWKEEREVKARQQAELVRVARISMEQAIQNATGQQPGKVLECSLNGEHWEAPGKLARDGWVFYHVVIHSGDEANPTVTHILVNAIDGSIMKTEKEDR